LLAQRGSAGVRVLEFGTLEVILACVAAGIGVTLLPRALVETARRSGQVRIHALPPEDAMVDTVFVRRRDSFVPSALSAFIAIATHTFNAIAEPATKSIAVSASKTIAEPVWSGAHAAE